MHIIFISKFTYMYLNKTLLFFCLIIGRYIACTKGYLGINGEILRGKILTKNNLKNGQLVGMLLQKRTDTRGVGISNMRKSIYFLTITHISC